MKLLTRVYPHVVTGAGLVLVAAVIRFSLPQVMLVAVWLLPLAAFGYWLRIGLEPAGSITVAPAMLLAILVIAGLPPAMVAAAAAAAFVHRLAGRLSWEVILQRVGEELLSLLAAWVVYEALGGPVGLLAWPTVVPYAAAAAVFFAVRFAFQSAGLSMGEGIRVGDGVRMLLRGAGVHALVLAAAGLGLAFLYLQAGYLGLYLGGIVLVETYYPRKLLGEQKGILFTSLRMMAAAVDAKDPYTSNHSQNVARYAVRLARALGLPEDEVERIQIGGLMHDLGKIGITSRVIRKPSTLSPDEFELMRGHPALSASIIEPIQLLGEAAGMVRHHHEHYDGSGYPGGLIGEDIPLGSRVILVADAFDAITTDRPYRPGRSRETALHILRMHAGKQFDARVVSALATIADRL